MNKYNHVLVEGSVGYDPRVKETPKGFTVGELLLKCKAGKNGTLFIDVTVWDKNLLKIVETVKQGDVVKVTGELRSSSWQTPTGERRTKHNINAETLVVQNEQQSSAFDYNFDSK